MQGTSFEVQNYWGLSPRKKMHEGQKIAMLGDLMAPPLIYCILFYSILFYSIPVLWEVYTQKNFDITYYTTYFSFNSQWKL